MPWPWLKRMLLRREEVPDAVWQCVRRDVLDHYALSADEMARLRDLTCRFLGTKSFSGASGFVVDDYVRTVIASVACLLVMELDLDWYGDWVEIIVYPDSFIVEHEATDEVGVTHHVRQVLGGESWDRGPVILSWEDARPDQSHGPHVIVHEFSHKLDMRNGAADGFPPPHSGMVVGDWTRAFTGAFESLQHDLDIGRHTLVDPYAASSPAEFFAVISEDFFEIPMELRREYPAVYAQLCLFYRQDPASRYQS